MNIKLFFPVILLFSVHLAASCQSKPVSATPARISQFERTGYSEFLIDRNGVYHVLFQESPDIGKSVFIYYSASGNNGQTWSKPLNISNDNSGNGSGYPRLTEGKDGTVYAFWKRYGNPQSQYPVQDVSLDGRGGYAAGTIFYKTLKNGAWSNAIQVSESFQSQFSYFPAVHPAGNVAVFWSEVSPQSLKNNWVMWYYADWIRAAVVTPGGVTGRHTYSEPSPGAPYNGAPEQKGMFNMDGYIDAGGKLRMILDKKENKQLSTWYFDGTDYKEVYKYPLYQEGNVFMNPAKLLHDEKGTDHIIIRPSSSVLESEQVWDIIPSQNKQNVLAEITQKGVSISGYKPTRGLTEKWRSLSRQGGFQTLQKHTAYFMTQENGPIPGSQRMQRKINSFTRNSALRLYVLT